MDIYPISFSTIRVILTLGDFSSSDLERLDLILLTIGLENRIYDTTSGKHTENNSFIQAHALLTIALEALLWPILVEDPKFQTHALSKSLCLLWAVSPNNVAKDPFDSISAYFGSSATMISTHTELINETRHYLENSGLLTEFV